MARLSSSVIRSSHLDLRMIKLFKGFLFDFIHIIQGTVIIPIK